MDWPLMRNTINDLDKDTLISFVQNTNRYTNGEKVKKFEEEWSTWLDVKYSLFVSSGSAANLLLVSSIKELYNLKSKDKVIIPACTWVTNVSPIYQVGLTPVFCDVNCYDFSFDKEYLKDIARKHNDIKVVFVTHLLGIPADILFYKKLFPNAIFIEDACEAHGAKIGDKKVGTFSEGSTFSFYFGHHMTSIEGGAVCTNDSNLYYLMKSKRSHGFAKELNEDLFEEIKLEYKEIDPSFLFFTEGYNFRNTEIGAVIGSSQLKRLDFMNKRRIKNFKLFIKIIKKYNMFEIPKEEGNCSFCLPFVVKDISLKNKIVECFRKNEIEMRPIISGNLLKQPFLKKYNIKNDFENANYLHSNGFYIGNNHFIGNKEMDFLSNLIDKCYMEYMGENIHEKDAF